MEKLKWFQRPWLLGYRAPKLWLLVTVYSSYRRLNRRHILTQGVDTFFMYWTLRALNFDTCITSCMITGIHVCSEIPESSENFLVFQCLQRTSLSEKSWSCTKVGKHTPCFIKTTRYLIVHNFGKCWPICKKSFTLGLCSDCVMIKDPITP